MPTLTLVEEQLAELKSMIWTVQDNVNAAAQAQQSSSPIAPMPEAPTAGKIRGGGGF